MRRNCWIKSRDERAELKALFQTADGGLSRFFSDNPQAREEHLEGRLLATLERDTPSAYEARMNENRSLAGRARLSIEFKHITHTETKSGADMGLIASLDIPGEIVLTKAVLLQSKKLYMSGTNFTENSTYKELYPSKSASQQWERLLDCTSSSAYLLIGPERLRIGRSVKDFGTQILSAQNVQGLANARMLPLTAAEAYDRGSRFADWMVDDFICCNTGDPSGRVIEIARGLNQNFPVRNTLEIDIRGRDLNSRLF